MNLQELLVTLVVMVIIFGIVFGSYLVYINVYKVQLLQNALTVEMNRSIAVSSKALRGAATIVNSHSIGIDAYTTGNTTIVIQVPSIDSNNAILNNTFDYFIITQSVSAPQQLILFIDPDPVSVRQSATTTLTDHLKFLQFNYDSADYATTSRIEIILSLEGTAGGRTIHNSGQTAVILRNS